MTQGWLRRLLRFLGGLAGKITLTGRQAARASAATRGKDAGIYLAYLAGAAPGVCWVLGTGARRRAWEAAPRLLRGEHFLARSPQAVLAAGVHASVNLDVIAPSCIRRPEHGVLLLECCRRGTCCFLAAGGGSREDVRGGGGGLGLVKHHCRVARQRQVDGERGAVRGRSCRGEEVGPDLS